MVANSINMTQSVYSSNIHIHTAVNTAANYNQMLHDTELMNVIQMKNCCIGLLRFY